MSYNFHYMRLVVTIFIICVSALKTIAQVDVPTSLPPSDFVGQGNQTDLPTVDMLILELQEMLAPYHIVLFADPSEVSPLSGKGLRELNLDATYLQDMFGIESASQISDVRLESDINTVVEAVIVLPEALVKANEEDLQWLKNSYWNGMVVGFLNVPLVKQWEILGIECIDEGYYTDYKSDGYFVYSFYVVPEAPEDLETILAAKQSCLDLAKLPLKSGYYLTQGIATDSLDTPYGAHQLLLVMGLDLQKYTEITQQMSKLTTDPSSED